MPPLDDSIPVMGSRPSDPPLTSSRNTFRHATRSTGKSESSDSVPSDLPPAELVEETKSQIRVLIHEVTQLAQADISWEEFAEGFMSRVGSALASVGGILWRRDESGGLQAQYQVNVAKTKLGSSKEGEERHRRLLRKVLQTGQPMLIPPQSGPSDDAGAGNPTDFLLVLGVFQVEGQVEGIVEIFQRPDGGPATQRGYLRFLVQMCDLVGGYEKNRRLRDYHEQQVYWKNLERFVRAAHHGLAVRPTAFTVANDGRSLVGCDRLSVVLLHGRRSRIEAVSGLDSLDRRATEIKLLEKLAHTVLQARQTLWYCRGSDEVAPQIDQRLQAYLDQSHSKMIAVVPLVRPGDESHTGNGPVPFGAIVAEQLADDVITDRLRHRLQVVAQHSSQALANAREHESLFLLPLWKWLGRRAVLLHARHLPKTLLALAAGCAILAAMVFVKAPFSIAARGKLQPVERGEVFAQTDGTVINVLVQHGSVVRENDLLVEMRNETLDVEILTLLERQTTTREQIESKQLTLVSAKSLSTVDESLLSGELAQLRESAKSIEQQLQLLNQKQRQLAILAPQGGEIMTWDVETPLLQRPVQRGQLLMAIANSAGEWELELYVPERRTGHLLDANRETGRSSVTFTLKGYPGEEFSGQVTEIHRISEPRGDEGNCVVVRVAIDKRTLPEAPSESSVVAKLHCGQRSLAYVWFGDVYDRATSTLFRWLP